MYISGGPGSGKGTQCEKIVQRYPNFVHLSMGDILPEEISTKGTADEKWTMISQLLSKGEMAPEVRDEVLVEGWGFGEGLYGRQAATNRKQNLHVPKWT